MKFFLVLLLISNGVTAHEAGETEAQVGPGKAVEAFDETKGIKLSEKAMKNLEIQTKKVSSALVPSNAILTIKDKTSVFVKTDGWFRMISTKEVKSGDDVVVHGAALLRVAQINVSAETEDDEHEEHSKKDKHDEHEGDDHD